MRKLTTLICIIFFFSTLTFTSSCSNDEKINKLEKKIDELEEKITKTDVKIKAAADSTKKAQAAADSTKKAADLSAEHTKNLFQ